MTEPPSPLRILLTGASGYVGGRLLPRLLADGHHVRALARHPEKTDLPTGADVMPGDVVSGAGLAEALDGVDVAYYLVHSMGGGRAADFAERDRTAARTFGAAARDAGVRRVIYLGGLESSEAAQESEHLRSRAEVAAILAEYVPEFVHVRAAMVIGNGSASFQILEHLVRRLPLMITPRWIDTRSQPVSIADTVGTLADLAVFAHPPAEVQLGGADVLTYREMMVRFSHIEGRRTPKILRVPVLTPALSSYWVALMTPVAFGLVRPLVDGLSSEMVVTTAPPAGLNDHPDDFDTAVRAASSA